MRPQTITVSSVSASAAIPMDYRQDPFNLNYAATIQTGPATFNVEVTLDDIFDPTVTPVWLADTSAATANTIKSVNAPIRAIRLNVTALTAGSVTLTVLQGQR